MLDPKDILIKLIGPVVEEDRQAVDEFLQSFDDLPVESIDYEDESLLHNIDDLLACAGTITQKQAEEMIAEVRRSRDEWD